MRFVEHQAEPVHESQNEPAVSTSTKTNLSHQSNLSFENHELELLNNEDIDLCCTQRHELKYQVCSSVQRIVKLLRKII